MPMLSRTLEKTLRRALALANARQHEYATLEHLLMALTEDQDALAVLKACAVEVERLRASLMDFLDHELSGLAVEGSVDAKPTAGFQRVIQRAAIHVQSSGRQEVTGANVLVALFSERESHAVFFLQEQNMTRLDAVNYIAHGIAKKPGMSEERRVRGADEQREPGEEGGHGGALGLLRQPQRQGARRPDRRPGRARARDRAHDPDPVPPLEEQPAVRRRPRRRQDRDRRGPGAAHRPGRGARGPQGRGHLRARPGRAARRDALPRRLRGAAQGRAHRARGQQARDPVHRRDPHRDRRRRHQRRLARRLEHPQAGAGQRRAALHRLDHLQGIPQLLREGPGAGPALPEDRHPGADRGRVGQDPGGPAAELRGAPPGPLHRRRARRRGQAVDPLHPRPQAAGQGDRRDRRGRCGADAAAGPPAQEDHQGARTSRRSSPR